MIRYSTLIVSALMFFSQTSQLWSSVSNLVLHQICLRTDNTLLSQEFTAPEELMHSKSQKQLVLTGAARFNAKPKTGLAFLEENKLIYADLSPNVSKAHSLATFLKNCTRLDKRLLGDFISKPDNIEILKAFIGLFDFKNVSTPEVHLASTLLNVVVSETRRRGDAGNA